MTLTTVLSITRCTLSFAFVFYLPSSCNQSKQNFAFFVQLGNFLNVYRFGMCFHLVHIYCSEKRGCFIFGLLLPCCSSTPYVFNVRKKREHLIQKSKIDERIEQMQFVKFVNRKRISFKAVSNLVWVCWKAMI